MKILRQLRALFRKEKLDAEMAEEMRAHLELQAAENEKRGMSRDEARYAACRSFGGVEQLKEIARDQRGGRWAEHFRQDVRYGLRQVRKHPGFTAVVVLILGLGLGANTAVFSALEVLMLRPLPVPAPEELVVVHRVRPGPRGTELDAYLSLAMFDGLREHAQSLAGVAAKIRPRSLTRSPCPATAWIALEPALAIEPSAFSTTFARPPRLLPGVGLALRSTEPRPKYSSYQRISRMRASPTSRLIARGVRR